MGTTASSSSSTISSNMDKTDNLYEREDSQLLPSTSQLQRGERRYQSPPQPREQFQVEPLRFYGSSASNPGPEALEYWEDDEERRITLAEQPDQEPEAKDEGENYLSIDESAHFSKSDDPIEMDVFPNGEYAFTLGKKGRFAVVQTLEYGVFISLREYFKKVNLEGVQEWHPTKKGIHLRGEEWQDLMEKMGAIDAQVQRMEKSGKAKLKKLEDRHVKKRGNVPYYNPRQQMKRIRPTSVQGEDEI